ncbi:MAG: hypothetical protein CVU38_04465 [Chloroflexi bacterium HGW-Chloroflexi-1]|nr:MAG: hypothetical protein CVU38_04465 [Chloroflexi bacterium HGW-Chloroflexi-1]
MHVEHIIPLARGGSSDEDNLWLTCAWCNSYKGAQTHAVDPLTSEEVALLGITALYHLGQRVRIHQDRWHPSGLLTHKVTAI